MLESRFFNTRPANSNPMIPIETTVLRCYKPDNILTQLQVLHTQFCGNASHERHGWITGSAREGEERFVGRHLGVNQPFQREARKNAQPCVCQRT
jgi:hypothetical protein